MRFLVIGAVSLIASGLTLFAGFGLGTLLTPAFALFFPAALAVALTAVVHLANNLFKLVLLGRRAHAPTVLRFGLPAAAAAWAGARTLVWLAGLEPLLRYEALGRPLAVTPVNAAVAALLLVFAGLELSPRLSARRFPASFMPLGGALSGFFGGLSGTQGALRSAFLVRAGLSKDEFVATGVAVACLVDVSRLSVYARRFALEGVRENAPLVAAACLCAFAGAFLGARLLEKATDAAVQRAVAAGLVLIALALGAGLL